MGEVNRFKNTSNEQELLATKEQVNGTFIMGEINRLKFFANEQEFLATKE